MGKRLFVRNLLYLCSVLICILFCVTGSVLAAGEGGNASPVEKLLPVQLGDFKLTGALSTSTSDPFGSQLPNSDFGTVSAVSGHYTKKGRLDFEVSIITTVSEDAAYAELKRFVGDQQAKNVETNHVDGLGTLAYRGKDSTAFFKGIYWVVLKSQGGADSLIAAEDFGRQLAASLGSADSDIPPLVKHLPSWMDVQDRARFALSRAGLEEILGSRPVLEAVDFSGGTEVVAAPYGPTTLVIVEFTTPQLATSNDMVILKRIAELKQGNGQLPVYRRVGNYSVFAFDAPDAKSADSLIDNVKYEQVVQWLGDNPNILRRAQHAYAAGTAAIILTVIKASGVSMVLCLGIGGLFGAFIFKRRRRKLANAGAYSDSGGMVRLGIDNLNVQPDAGRLLGPPKL